MIRKLIILMFVINILLIGINLLKANDSPNFKHIDNECETYLDCSQEFSELNTTDG